MRHIAASPRLRMLMGQGTVADRRRLRRPQPLRTSSTSGAANVPICQPRIRRARPDARPARPGRELKNALTTRSRPLPRFPALRELMPMDVPDEGFRHVGRCEKLGDAVVHVLPRHRRRATEHLAGLSRLKPYYAGMTKITDRSLEILGRMPTLGKLDFWESAADRRGITPLAGLPRLREIAVGGSQRDPRRDGGLSPTVRVNYPDGEGAMITAPVSRFLSVANVNRGHRVLPRRAWV